MKYSMSTVSLVSMSRKSIHISIPTPCHESWDGMDMTEHGAFCHSCQKEVIDFSAMTDREVIEYLAKHQAGCGRFRKDQLDTKLTIPEVNNGIFKWKALLLGILPFIGLKSAMAIPNHRVVTTDQSANLKAEKKDTAIATTISPKSDSLITISGRITDERDEGLVGVNIVLLDSTGRSTGAITTADYDGNYSLPVLEVRPSKDLTLQISYVGYATQIIKGIPSVGSQIVNAKLQLSTPYTNIGGAFYIVRRTPAQKIKYWFRCSFRIKHHS